ncbi:MAG: TIGR02300 family protein [Holosporaceae bacterium]|jgi:uncharacterized protein (TIGR02300 family)|nr:TIGR02300 family protein [Holosporaceae bacterium]
MDRSGWGIKRICLGCSTRFYDFYKSPIVCPSCGAVFDPEYLSKRKTKNLQGKSSDVIDVMNVVADEEDLIDESEGDLDDSEDIVIDGEKN